MTFIFDGTFEGLLTVVFNCYDLKLYPDKIERTQTYHQEIFDEPATITTERAKAERVHKGLRKKLSSSAIHDLVKAFHSGLPEIDMAIYDYIRLALHSKMSIEKDYRKDAVLIIRKAVQMMNREIHRMHAFVRFQKTADNIYAATIKPDFDVIPFIGSHFAKRYADQQWLIYDTQRNYGLFYDLQKVEIVRLRSPRWYGRNKINPSVLHEEEGEYQTLWKQYLKPPLSESVKI